jgi:hypothetical protein
MANELVKIDNAAGYLYRWSLGVASVFVLGSIGVLLLAAAHWLVWH